MLKDAGDRLESREVGALADPGAELAAVADGQGRDARGPGGREPGGRVFDRDGLGGRDAQPPQGQEIASGSGLTAPTSSLPTISSNAPASPGFVSTASTFSRQVPRRRPAGPRPRSRSTSSTTPGIDPRRVAEQRDGQRLLLADPALDVAVLDLLGTRRVRGGSRGRRPRRTAAATSSGTSQPRAISVRCQAAM